MGATLYHISEMTTNSEGMEGQVEAWTPEQQVKELKRRMNHHEALRSDIVLHETPPFKPNQDDVIVAVPPKNGTTWLIHICHQIRMQGQEPDFGTQLDVVAWIETAETWFGKDPATQQQPAKPRIFITHLPYPLVSTGGRRIYCFRNQKDATISAYHFYNSILLLNDRVSLSIFARAWLQKVEKRLKDLLLWWEHRHDDNLLLLFFDDLKDDHVGCVRQIAKFIGVDCDEDVIARVVHTTSHAEMARCSSKFNATGRKIALRVAEKTGDTLTPESEFSGRVRKSGGKSGEGKQLLPIEIQQLVDQLWQEIISAKLGFQSLEEMRQAWKKEQLRG